MTTTSPLSHPRLTLAAATGLSAVIAVAAISLADAAHAAGPPDPGLGSTARFAVLAGSGVTNKNATTISGENATGDVGSFPTTAVTGSASITTTGTVRFGDKVTEDAKPDLVQAYLDAEGAQPPTALDGDLDGETLRAGVHKQASALLLTGTVTLDAQGDASSVFIIQVGSDFTTASSSKVALVNGAQACHVYWQIGRSATFGSNTDFKGTVLALTSITADSAATFDGRLLARNGAVTLDNNTINLPKCITPTATSPAPTTPVVTKAPTPTPTKKPSTKDDKKKDDEKDDKKKGGKGGDDDERSSTGGGSDGDGGGDGTSSGGSGTSTDGGTGGGSSSTTGLPDTGGPPLYLAPVGALALLTGVGLVFAARGRVRGTHRA